MAAAGISIEKVAILRIGAWKGKMLSGRKAWYEKYSVPFLGFVDGLALVQRAPIGPLLIFQG